MNIKELNFYKENQKDFDDLINNYNKLTITRTIRGTFFILDKKQLNLLKALNEICLIYEMEIDVNNENMSIYATIDRLIKSSIVI